MLDLCPVPFGVGLLSGAGGLAVVVPPTMRSGKRDA
jgi:hypothetical protein